MTSGGEDYTCASRPIALGKSIYLGRRKLHMRGVTYGTFRPTRIGAAFPARRAVAGDFAAMAAAAINAVRTYTVAAALAARPGRSSTACG